MSAQTTYPLSPLQQGMLFHALAEPRSGVDIEQLVFTLREPVDEERMREAWERVVRRHDILRTSFRWDGAEPLQVVQEAVEVPFVVHETRVTEGDFSNWLREDRAQGFAMDAAPLLRFRLFAFGAEDYRLMWTFHHALLDGRSFPPLIEEAFAFYDAAPGAGESPARPPRPYRDFIAWHTGREHSASEKFWREKLGGLHAPTPLTIEGLGELTAERAQGDAEIALSEESTAALKAFAASMGVTLNTTVQAAWALLLHRYSGEENVCFGATRAGRRGTIEGAEDMIGLFINTVPVRTRVSPDRSLAELLRELRDDWVEVRAHEHTPLARVQAWSEVPAGQPLFRTLVVFENYDLAEHFRALGGAWSRRELRLHEQTNFPICLAAYAGLRLRLVAEYDRSRLDESLVQGLLRQLATLLAAMPAQPDARLADLPLLPPEEEAALLANKVTDFPAGETLHALFTRQAARTPQATALVQGDVRLTYAELDARANAVAAHLAALGVGEESSIGLCLERCPELVIALLGILKANAAYLPIDLAYPPERLAFMLEDAHAPVLLTQRHLADRLPPGHGARLVFIEDISESAATFIPNAGSPEQLCYVLYTSGSTGKPKGCCVTHHNVARLFTATDAWFHFDASDVWTLFHSTAFDFSVWEIWGALLYGGTLVVVPFEVSRSPEQFRELLVHERVTVLNQTPSAFRQLIAADASAGNPAALALRYVIFGGEALEMRTLQPWFERHGDTRPRLVNMYGITETTVHVTYRPLRAGDIVRGSVIGVPIPDLQLLILDPQLRPVPTGVPGELFVAGAGLARGYHQRPDLTETRFIPHPAEPGARLYRTGDLARRLPDGDVEYLGRIDQQVKIRGFRIELGEIESVLLQHPRIREAAVLAPDDGHGGKKLVAWIVEEAAAPAASAADLRAHLKSKLPDYMVPAAFVPVARMPLTGNGKLDARALPAPPESRAPAETFVAPSTPAEQALASIWQRILKLQRVGIHDNFFDLGGDSILTILVVSQARQQGLALTPKLLFDHPTIAGLAQHAGSTKTPMARLVDSPMEGEVPLTPIQRWFFRHDFAEPHHWNQSLAFSLSRPVDPERLASAFTQVLAAHSAFRLRFERTTEGWCQFFAPESDEGSALRAKDEAGLQSSLGLGGPLLRYTYDEPTGRLVIAAHHLIVDGVSWRILLEDLDAALRGAALGGRSNGFHTWSRALAVGKLPRTEMDYWSSLPSPAPLPRDFPSGENLESSTQTHVFRFSSSETAILLRDFRTQEALLCGLAHALSALTGQQNHIIELEGHGREEATLAELASLPAVPDVARTIGWFTTIFPLGLTTRETPAETLTATIAALSAVPRRGFGFMLVEPACPSADVLFNYLGQFDQTTAGLEHFTLTTLDTADWHGPANRRTHVLEINALVLHAQLEVRITFSANLHKPKTIENFAASFQSSLRALFATPARFPLAKLDSTALASLSQRYPAIEDIYPLSPMQRLFLALEIARPGSGSDQWHCKIIGPLDPDRLQTAWTEVTHRHATLRTAYLSERAEPLQLVVAEANPAWHQEDLRSVSPAARQDRIHAYLRTDAGLPFDLAHPLTRFALFSTGEEEHVLVWTHHHLEIDGWSWPLVFREWNALLSGEEQRPLALSTYRDYIAWLLARPDDLPFWRNHLAGLREATRLPLALVSAAPATEISLTLPHAETTTLTHLARDLQVTPNVLVQTAWALLLAHHGRQDDIVFGAAFSGRPAELPGSENIVGHFVTNLPVRARIAPGETLAAFAQALHRQLAQLAEHQYTPLPQIEASSELPWSARLFSTLVVFQNYLAGDLQLGAAKVEEMNAPVRTNYPLTLVVNPGEQLTVTLVAQLGVAGSGALQLLAVQLAELLNAFRRDITLGHLTHFLPAPIAFAKESEISPHSGPVRPVAPALPHSATDLERTISEIWQTAFGREVSPTENFFDLGGHSLLMLRVHARLTDRLGRDIPVVTLFQHPTIRALAQALGGTPASGPAPQIAAAQDRAAKARAALARRPLHPRST